MGESSDSGDVILYRAGDGSEMRLRAVDGTVWLTQHQMADLYGTSVPNIAQIVQRVIKDGEVAEATINSELMVRQEGARQVRREVKVYNLDMILAVGYRVTTTRAVQFRQWASSVLKEYLVKGFALADDRLKGTDTSDYFDELLERIRDIRASEKRFYQKVRDVFAQTSADYDGASDVAREFFATIQNKLLFAVTGKTAAELIHARIDVNSSSLGLTTWKGDRVRKADVSVAKNYLTEPEISLLNRLTTMFLDFAEVRAARRQQTLMTDWVTQTDRFLEFNEQGVLIGPGSVSHQMVEELTTTSYVEWDERRKREEAERAEAQEIEELWAQVDASRRGGER